MSLNKFALILDEGPIARSYLQYLLDNKIKINELIYLGSKTFFLNLFILTIIFILLTINR